MLIPNIAAR